MMSGPAAALPEMSPQDCLYKGEHMKNKDPKTKLNHFCQRYVGRMVLKGDVVYKSGKVAGTDMFQATAQLFCMEGGPVFAGELARDKKLSEQEAAKQALAAYAEEVEKLAKNPRCFQKGFVARPDFEYDSNELCRLWKQRLHDLVIRVTKKPIAKGDIDFQTERQEDGAFITTLKLPCMAETVWGTQEWSSDLARNGKDGEQLAAKKAVEAMFEDPTFAEDVEKIKEKEAEDELQKAKGGDKDPKTALAMFCQKWTGRIIGKGDLVYTCAQVQGPDGNPAFQATVQMFCMQDEPCFAGEPNAMKKLAEYEAAKVAIENYSPEMEMLVAVKKRAKSILAEERRNKKREDVLETKAQAMAKKTKEKAEPGFPYKSRLFELIMKIVRKALTKEDVCYDSKKQPNGQWVCTLTFPCMSSTWGTTPWVSENCPSQKEAELSSSQKAFIKMRQDPQFQQYVSMLEKGQKHISPSRIANQNKSRGFVGRAKNGGVIPRESREVSHNQAVKFGESSYTSSGSGGDKPLW